MSDDEKEHSEEEEGEEEEETAKEEADKKKEPVASEVADVPPKVSEAELQLEKMRKKKEEEETMWAEYMEQWKKQRSKEDDELKKLKDKQVRRKERRAEEEKKLVALKKQQEAQRSREMEEKKARDAEAKRKRMEDAERKRKAMQEALADKKNQEPITPNFVISKKLEDGGIETPVGFEKISNVMYGRGGEVAKSKEQLAEEKRIALSVRVKPLQIEGITVAELRQKAEEMWDAIVRAESEKYDLEERKKRQEYDLKELSERQRQINRSKALKKGLDPEALTGKFPPMINVASKYERRLDRRSFIEKKSLYEGGYVTNTEAVMSDHWEQKTKTFKERGPSRLLKWDPNAPKVKETTEPRAEEDEDEDGLVPPPFGAGEEGAADSANHVDGPAPGQEEEEEEAEEEEEDEEEEEEEEEE